MTKNNTKEWWIWERPAAINLIYVGALCAMHPLKVEHGACYSDYLYCFFKNEMIKVACDFEQLRNNGKKVLPNFINKESYQNIKNEWNKRNDTLQEECNKIINLDLTKFQDNELLENFTQFKQKYQHWWAYTQVAELVSYASEALLKEHLSKEQFDQYFVTLITPTRKSVSNTEEEHLAEIALFAKEHGIDNPQTKAKIEEHAQQFYWLLNNFHTTKKLDGYFFKKRILELIEEHQNPDGVKVENKARLKKAQNAKDAAITTLSLDEKYQRIVWLVDEFAQMQDQRKALDMQCNYISDYFCREVARRKEIEYKILRSCTPLQMESLLKGEPVDINIIKKQAENCAIIYNDYNDTPEILLGEKADLKRKEVFGDNSHNDIKSISGMSACTGSYTGTVRVILHSKDIGQLQAGEVLVTTMTSPDFVTGMKKAGAIITDEGGVTCHAAVVSRELGVPCIIGTKIATNVLKDGMNVEVDATNGVITILESTGNQ